MTDFKVLQEESHNTAEDKGFQRYSIATDEETRNNYIGTKLMLVVGEVAEAQEELRSGYSPTTRYYGEGGKPEGFPAELADVVIRVMALAGELGIDLQDAIEEKQAYNATRPHGHGRKF